jgi:hypothetical protein
MHNDAKHGCLQEGAAEWAMLAQKVPLRAMEKRIA